MRGLTIAALTIVLSMIVVSGAAIAQTATVPAEPPSPAAVSTQAPAPGGVSRDDYIAKAKEAAEKRAAKRFDAMDANHDGVLTPDEIAAYRAAHSRKKQSPPQ